MGIRARPSMALLRHGVAAIGRGIAPSVSKRRADHRPAQRNRGIRGRARPLLLLPSARGGSAEKSSGTGFRATERRLPSLLLRRRVWLFGNVRRESWSLLREHDMISGALRLASVA